MMLQLPLPVGPASAKARMPLWVAIQLCGLTASILFCLDAGDALSYDGSSQTWSDRSPNGYHFYRGTGSGSDAADPAFNGVAGRNSSDEFFSSDGGDRFEFTGAASVFQQLHGVGSLLSALQTVYMPSDASNNFGLNTAGAGSDGLRFLRESGSANQFQFEITTGNPTATNFGHGAAGPTISSWPILAIVQAATQLTASLTNGYTIGYDGTYGTGNVAPLGTRGNSTFKGLSDTSTTVAGTRHYNMAIWHGVRHTDAQMLALYYAVRGKFSK